MLKLIKNSFHIFKLEFLFFNKLHYFEVVITS